LRQLEEDGFVTSSWQTDEAGPAKRAYNITPEGRDALCGWVDFMEQQAMNLLDFVERFKKLSS
jgi:DNA-binding PadR family transcriptional regulator